MCLELEEFRDLNREAARRWQWKWRRRSAGLAARCR